jgi:hypothetical protein
MPGRVDQPERVFQLWSYTVGMGKLLLRSVKTASFTTRLDVLFQNVQAVKLPTVLHGLTVSTAEANEIAAITGDTGLLPDAERSFFLLSGSGYNGYIVAGIMLSCEDSLEYFEPSEIWPQSP